jgi:hypothetical protein
VSDLLKSLGVGLGVLFTLGGGVVVALVAATERWPTVFAWVGSVLLVLAAAFVIGTLIRHA